jgi:hypothetical protein
MSVLGPRVSRRLTRKNGEVTVTFDFDPKRTAPALTPNLQVC